MASPRTDSVGLLGLGAGAWMPGFPTLQTLAKFWGSGDLARNKRKRKEGKSSLGVPVRRAPVAFLGSCPRQPAGASRRGATDCGLRSVEGGAREPEEGRLACRSSGSLAWPSSTACRRLPAGSTVFLFVSFRFFSFLFYFRIILVLSLLGCWAGPRVRGAVH